jgi:hypothetical protein
MGPVSAICELADRHPLAIALAEQPLIMRSVWFWRQPWRFLLLWTGLCAIPAGYALSLVVNRESAQVIDVADSFIPLEALDRRAPTLHAHERTRFDAHWRLCHCQVSPTRSGERSAEFRLNIAGCGQGLLDQRFTVESRQNARAH